MPNNMQKDAIVKSLDASKSIVSAIKLVFLVDSTASANNVKITKPTINNKISYKVKLY